MLAFVALVIIALQYLQTIDAKISLDGVEAEKMERVLVSPATPDEPYFVLLMGSDYRGADDVDRGRSDTIILARIDPAVPSVALVSIPRDTEVDLEGHGPDKINEAYTLDGPSGTVKAVANLCGVDIAHYIEIDFSGLVSLVDELGGIDVNLPVDIDLDGHFLPAGSHHLDGELALIVSRCRTFVDGDYQRVINQRIVLQAIAGKILAADKIELPGLIVALADCIKTDVHAIDAPSLLLRLQGMDTANGLDMATIPSYPNYHDDTSFIAVEQPAFNEMMERFKRGEKLVIPVAEEEPGSVEESTQGSEPEAGDALGGGDG